MKFQSVSALRLLDLHVGEDALAPSLIQDNFEK
jgi:hypothetical protein